VLTSLLTKQSQISLSFQADIRARSTLFIRKGEVSCVGDRRGQCGIVLLGGGRRDDDAAHQLRVIRRGHPRDPAIFAPRVTKTDLPYALETD
jgi:hypothetical protein